MSRARFYKEAHFAEDGGDFVVLLDSKPAKTQRGARLVVPTRALAEAIAAEWNAQGERLDPARMPLTRLVNLAIDRVPDRRGEIVEHALGFGRTDLLCYRAEEPPELAARQRQIWDPLLRWALASHGIRLVSDRGIAYVEQPIDALVRMQEIVSGLDDFALVAFDTAATLSGSFVLALALCDRRVTAEEAFAAAQLDELYQAQKWGRDAEAEARRDRLLEELKTLDRFNRLFARN
jgi:chaperone required for assembly of F1-ATPase